jgi:thioredoxin-dependent peroxiredoxin
VARHPETGDAAPDFELDGTEGTFRLSDHRGERVILLFYPGDNTPVCTRQFCSYRDHPEAFGQLDATVVGISSQSVESHSAFRDKHGLTVPLLADQDGVVAKAYGSHRPLVGTRRTVVIVDEQGLVRHRHDSRLGLTFQTADDLRAALDAVPVPTASE